MCWLTVSLPCDLLCSIDTPGVILRVSSLFRGYPNLILGFNTFLPPGYRIRPDTSIEVIPQQPLPGRPVNPPSMFSSNVPPGPQPSNANVGQVRPPPVTIPPPSYSPADLQSGAHHAGKQSTPSRQPLAPAQSGQSKSSGQGGQGKQSSSKKLPQSQQSLPPAQNPPSQGAPGASRSATNPVEFDHAIHYVTTIKQRFADEPETYKEFLAILHTYQKEQRSIRQVLDQVSYLFRDHPDLLREFTFFLPDAVQEQATERLNRAAKKAEERKAQLANQSKFSRDGGFQPQGHSYQQSIPHQPGNRRDDGRAIRSGGDSPSGAASKSGRSMLDDHAMSGEDGIRSKGGKMGRDQLKTEPGLYKHASTHDESRLTAKQLERREKERERERNKALFASKRSKRRPYDAKERRGFLALSDVLIDKEEWGIFEKIKKILPSRENWREFLKCLELYSQEVLRREEMLSLIKNLFGRHTELVEEFDNLLCSHGVQKSPKEIWPFIPLAETDLSQCRRATPSYRALPASYPIPPCSYRSKLERSVCNDSWVSVPTGSEDFSFKNMRKNQYEEALFKCEDERFEIDMVIDANACTISVLEPLAREIEVLKDKEGGEDKLWNYVVDKGTFRVTHLNAISRIYGEAGAQILDLLRKYPAGAIPVIIKRLKQKDEEWRRARQDLNKQWKEVNEKNYHKSLDHSSFYFKQKDKKQTSLKVLMQEAKKKLESDEKAAADSKAIGSSTESASFPPAAASNAPPEASDIADALRKEQLADAKPAAAAGVAAPPSSAAPPPWKPHFKYRFASVQIHKDTFGLLSYAAEKNLSVADKEKVSKVWQSFFFPFFHLEEEWLVRKPKRTTVSVEKAKSLRAGTEVNTDFGEGTVLYYNQEKGYHAVNLPIGQAYLQPGAITIQEASDFPPGLEALDDEADAGKTQAKHKTTFYGTQHTYGFLRLYQMLHNRLERAFELCEKAKRNRYRRTINPAARALAHARHTLTSDVSGKEKTGDYQAFLSKLYALIDGSVDNTKYEDCCRSLMGSTSYFLFTMDKLVSLVLKQMQQLSNDDTSQELLKVFAEQHELTKAASSEDDDGAAAMDPVAYLNKTKSVFEGEGAFRLDFHPGVLRRTPLEPRAATTPSAADSFDRTNFKSWAPSPRVKQQEPSKWLIEPELSIEYLGSMDDDGDEDDEDESPAVTPFETPSATPVGSPSYRDPSDENEKTEPGGTEVENEVENSGEESGEVMSDEDEEDAAQRDPSVVATILKKRTRLASEEDGSSTDTGSSSAVVKKAKTQDDDEDAETATGDDDELEEGEETGEEPMEEDHGVVADLQDDPMTGGEESSSTPEDAPTVSGSSMVVDDDDEEEEDEAFGSKSDANSASQEEEDEEDGGNESKAEEKEEGEEEEEGEEGEEGEEAEEGEASASSSPPKTADDDGDAKEQGARA